MGSDEFLVWGGEGSGAVPQFGQKFAFPIFSPQTLQNVIIIPYLIFI
jgi:hypothetical protein